jgi:hypothetical protein
MLMLTIADGAPLSCCWVADCCWAHTIVHLLDLSDGLIHWSSLLVSSGQKNPLGECGPLLVPGGVIVDFSTFGVRSGIC